MLFPICTDRTRKLWNEFNLTISFYFRSLIIIYTIEVTVKSYLFKCLMLFLCGNSFFANTKSGKILNWREKEDPTKITIFLFLLQAWHINFTRSGSFIWRSLVLPHIVCICTVLLAQDSWNSARYMEWAELYRDDQKFISFKPF